MLATCYCSAACLGWPQARVPDIRSRCPPNQPPTPRCVSRVPSRAQRTVAVVLRTFVTQQCCGESYLTRFPSNLRLALPRDPSATPGRPGFLSQMACSAVTVPSLLEPAATAAAPHGGVAGAQALTGRQLVGFPFMSTPGGLSWSQSRPLL